MKLPTFYEVWFTTYDSHCDFGENTHTEGRYLYKSRALAEFKRLREELKEGWGVDDEWDIINHREYFSADDGSHYAISVGISEVDDFEIDERKKVE